MAISTSSSILFPFSTKSQLPLNHTLFSISPSASDSHSSWKWRTQLLLHQPALPISKRTRKNVVSAISTDSEVSTRSGETENETELAKKWREIHGSGDWANLLDPMNPILRSELIRYGEMTQACYDSFVYDPYSKYCGTSRYPLESFFQSLGLESEGYQVTRFLYATGNTQMPNLFIKPRFPKLWSTRANWIGYVAVSDEETSKRLGRRDILIAWRGTVTRLEWVADMTNILNPISSRKIQCPDPSVKVEFGFLDLYTDKDEECEFCKYSAREQILAEMKRLLEKYKEEEVSITITGHSLGSALATLSAYDIAETGLNKTSAGRDVHISVFSFGGPRVGNMRFSERMNDLGVKVLRVVNIHDIVPKSPGLFLNEKLPPWLLKMTTWLPWSYVHVGVELELDHLESPYLRRSTDAGCSHNLEAHLHLLDGYQGKGMKFELAIGRDPALVNKSCDFLEDKYMVPPMWRQDENKGMIYVDGRWVFADRSDIDGHPEDTHYHLKEIGLFSEKE
ncbi:phospholipase A1-Igamma2, chloroplastic [Cucumis sativus]|uniref:Fungal lipase-type domain-containing protein n=1 Tax=Cucumis sativus TaxID=3659 RepID=A0A0A0K4W0_CUCSA|nr:phospholipase A1-Igamma2, chloroplastic [Cucumis sativus]KGN44760.1 hypothetical protein Csa_016368 [Cucumis sativus]